MRLIFFGQGETIPRQQRSSLLAAPGYTTPAPMIVQQALRLADGLFRARIAPTAIFSGSAPSMRNCADILARRLNVKNSPAVDERLTDAGYSRWQDLLGENCGDRLMPRNRYDWRERSALPSRQFCGPAEDNRCATIEAFIDSITRNHRAGDTVVAVTGHGLLRCLGALMRRRLHCPSLWAWRRVDPGNICRLLYYGSRLHVVSWNERPVLSWEPPTRTVRAPVRRYPSAAGAPLPPVLASVNGTISRGAGAARAPEPPGFGQPGRLKQGL